MAIYDVDGNELSGLDYYWIVSLDCGRKYFSVANVKALIDECASAKVNQLQLHFSENEGFRLALNDKYVYANGVYYDLSPCYGGTESPYKWYTESDMNEIIAYANSKSISIVPSLDMPGHMGRILSQFTQFKLDGTNTLNVKDSLAVNFAKGIVDKYASYFASKGCRWYNMGYDEIKGWATGFPEFYNNGEFQYVVDFANELATVIKSHGLIPRAFNEPFHYNNDSNYQIDTYIECLYWDGSITNEVLATPPTLQNLGYTLINSNEKYYWVLNSSRKVTAEYLANADLLKGFDVESTPKNGKGAMFCVWCDNPTSSQANDEGTGVVTDITPLIAAYGEAIETAMSGLEPEPSAPKCYDVNGNEIASAYDIDGNPLY